MKSADYQGQKVLVVGLGISGRSAAYFLLHKGAIVHGTDRNIEGLATQPELVDLKKLGLISRSEASVSSVDEFDLIIMSPGIPPTHPVYALAKKSNVLIWGEIELGCRSVTNRVIGITGTNGKTTVTLLVTHVLNQSGKKARALGNVGMPLTKELLSVQPDEILVLELSSYQLETLYQRVLDVGVILNITPDHLDRYGTMQAYAEAKFYMERCLKPNSSLYIEERSYHEFGSLLKEKQRKVYGYSPDGSIYTDLKNIYVEGDYAFTLPLAYQGTLSHDVENMMAAYALCREMDVSPDSFLKAFQSFKKPAHRIEFVTEKSGVFYYDDSKGTNVDAVIRAVQSLQGSIILIAGGVDKGSAYTPWIEGFTNKVKYVCAIGQAAIKIHDQLSHKIPVKIFSNLDQAVQSASQLAQEGDNVLLSPGCSSFDMFRDYAHRGEEFQRIVRQL